MTDRPIVALTGATGFIGRHLLRELQRRGYRVRVLLRRPTSVALDAPSAVVGDIQRPGNMSAALADAFAVVHSAGLAPGMSGVPEDDYRALNTDATVALALAAERAGVRRFVFMSSIRAQSGPAVAGVLTEAREPQPQDAYGRSKLAAEIGLAQTGIDWVALRPVLVFGPGVAGNMARLIRLARSPWPLPLAGLPGRRSLLSLDNLAAAVDAVLRAPGPLRRPFIAADPDPLSLPEIVGALRSGLGRRPGLYAVPPAVLKAACAAMGRAEDFELAASSLVADSSALRELGWAPPQQTRDALSALMRA